MVWVQGLTREKGKEGKGRRERRWLSFGLPRLKGTVENRRNGNPKGTKVVRFTWHERD